MYPLQQCIHCNNVPTVAMQSLLQCIHHSNVFIATMYPPQQRIHCGNVSATAIYLSQKWIQGRIHGRNVPTAAMGPLQQQHIPWSHRMVKDCTPHSEAPQTERTPQHRGTCQVTVGCSETQLRHVFLTHCQSQAREQRLVGMGIFYIFIAKLYLCDAVCVCVVVHGVVCVQWCLVLYV